MGWQCRAPWLTLLVFLWLVVQGALPLAGAPGSPRGVNDPETEMWSLVRDSLHPADVAAFLQAYPNGKYAPAARLKLQQLQRPQSGPPPQVVPIPLSRLPYQNRYQPYATAWGWSLYSFRPVSS